MNSIFDLKVNENAHEAYKDKKYSICHIIFILLFRVIMFLVFQTLFFLLFAILKQTSPWETAANWWPITVILTNLLCVFLLNNQ